MAFMIKLRKPVSLLLAALLLAACAGAALPARASTGDSDYIKWVDFDIPAALLKQTIELDVASRLGPAEARISWIELLAYLAVRCGGDFGKYKASRLTKLIDALSAGESMESLTQDMELYGYYLEAYTAVLGGLVGEYEVETEVDGRRTWVKKYGLRAFHPIARGYAYSEFDDFGAGRSYGYKRKHLGHDMMALVGTPVVACESGTVEELGWNQYGGWRVGVRSFDGLRYWYYAHLRQNRPFAEGLERGDVVMAGEVIGYVGRTGYSATENTNGIKQSHLHLGLQLIFDESQKDGVNQIWIDMYDISKLLSHHRSETVRSDQTKEHTRAFGYRETVPEHRFIPPDPAPQTAAAITPDVVSVPVLMYHDILKDPARQGPYTMTPWEFEDDLRYLSQRGYESVTSQQLVDFVEQGAPLPDKPVMLTFDDGHYNNVYYCEELLQKYGMRAVMFVVGAYCERSSAEGEQNPNYSYVTWESVRRMNESGLWDIQSHSWDMHRCEDGARRGASRLPGESDEHYAAALVSDSTLLAQRLLECTGRAPLAFAYPFGLTDDMCERTLYELGYRLTVGSYEGIATVVRGDASSLRLMQRLPRGSGSPLSQQLDSSR